MLFTLSLAYYLEGRKATQKFTSKALIRSQVAPGAEQILDWAPSYVNLFKPVFNTSMELYSLTVSPIAVPGTRKRTRNDHVIYYAETNGTHELPAGVDPALLTVTAQFVKLATQGTAGMLFLRGVINEDELKSDAGGEPLNQNADIDAAPNARFRTFAAALPGVIATLGQGMLIMPGPRLTATGGVPSTAVYEASARDVGKVLFDGFTEVQLRKKPKSIESKVRGVLKTMINHLRTAYLDALQLANGVENAIPAATRATLLELGHVIFLKFTPAERLSVRTEPQILAFII
jgi:hypothetical protein